MSYYEVLEMLTLCAVQILLLT